MKKSREKIKHLKEKKYSFSTFLISNSKQSEKKLKLFSIYLFYFCDIFPYLFFILFKRKKITFFCGLIFLFLILFKKPNTIKKIIEMIKYS